MTQTILPRPIAWILSESHDQSLNLAPFSYFNAVSSNPPLVMVSMGAKPSTGGYKDSLTNILKKGHCVVHIGSMADLDAMNGSAEDLDYGESEVTKLGLKTTPFDGCPLPRISSAPIAMDCRLHSHQLMGHDNQNLVFLEITQIYYHDDIVKHQTEPFRLTVDAMKTDPFCRLGAGEYANLGSIHRRSRPGA